MAVIKITDENFKSEVLESDRPVLIDFWAEWCQPCRRLSPLIDELSDEYPEYKFGKVNVDEQAALAAKFSVMSIPALFVFKNGEKVNSSVGVIPKSAVLELLK